MFFTCKHWNLFIRRFPEQHVKKTKIDSVATVRELQKSAARERLEELTERSVQIFQHEEEQSIENEAAAEGGT